MGKYDRIKRYTKDPESGCWVWYGAEKVWYEGRMWYPTTLLWTLIKKEPVGPGMMLRQLCATPSCVNPDHRERVPKDSPIQPYRWGSRR